jgi:hypothetical protein
MKRIIQIVVITKFPNARPEDSIIALDEDGELFERSFSVIDRRYFWNPLPTLSPEEYRSRSVPPPP